MPWRPFSEKQLIRERYERQKADDARTHDAVREAREKRQERTAQIRLTETRGRLHGWSA